MCNSFQGRLARGHHSTVGSTSGVSGVHVDSDDEGMDRDALPPLPRPRWSIDLCQGGDIVPMTIAPPVMDEVPQIDPRYETVSFKIDLILLILKYSLDTQHPISLHRHLPSTHKNGSISMLA